MELYHMRFSDDGSQIEILDQVLRKLVVNFIDDWLKRLWLKITNKKTQKMFTFSFWYCWQLSDMPFLPGFVSIVSLST